jgi:hypothetical protein
MRDMYAYLICHNRCDLKTHTYIGLTANYDKRLKQHNCQISGGPRSTRRAAGSWETIMVLKIPADRPYSSKIIKRCWKQTARGVDSRIRKGFVLAIQYGLEVYIKRDNKIPLLTFKWKSNTASPGQIELDALFNT